jgi:hypothetical protein
MIDYSLEIQIYKVVTVPGTNVRIMAERRISRCHDVLAVKNPKRIRAQWEINVELAHKLNSYIKMRDTMLHATNGQADDSGNYPAGFFS